MQTKRRVTLKDIANQVGCSVTAVSKVINGAKGTAGVSAATEERVWQIARELGYTPNYLAQALHRGQTKCIGLVSQMSRGVGHDVAYWSRVVFGIEQRLAHADHDLLLIGCTDSATELHRAIDCLLQRRVDALIVPTRMYVGQLDLFEGLDYPIVFSEGEPPPNRAAVVSDGVPGLAAALDHLLALGHRDVIWSPHVLANVIETPRRHEAVLDGCAARGMGVVVWPVELDEVGDAAPIEPLIASARDQFARRLAGGLPGTAFITYSERSAIGVVAALGDHGLHVPNDISVLSFDDLYAEYCVPALTVVSADLVGIGARVADLAIELATRQAAEPMVVAVPSHLVIRASTAAAAAQ